MHVLIIDDESATAAVMHRIVRTLVPDDWTVYHTTDPAEGRSLLVLDPRVRFCLCDLLMPGLAGDTLIADAIHARPELRGRIIVSSGIDYPPELAHRLFVELGCRRLDKPVEIAELQRVVCEVIYEGRET